LDNELQILAAEEMGFFQAAKAVKASAREQRKKAAAAAKQVREQAAEARAAARALARAAATRGTKEKEVFAAEGGQ
jgi:hypothetical protein